MINKIDELIDTAISSLADDNINIGAESLVLLAQLYAKAGFGIREFFDMRSYIINEAIKRTDKPFIDYKLQQFERLLQHGRQSKTN